MDYSALFSLLNKLPGGAVTPDTLRLCVGAATAPLFGLGALGALYAPQLLHLEWLAREVDRLDLTKQLSDGRVVTRSPMDWRADRLAVSKHEAVLPSGVVVREADHLYLGVEPFARFPVLLAMSLLSEHMYVSGQSGSGKTSKMLLPIAQQVAARGAPLVIFDLKGDRVMAEALRSAVPPDRWRFFSLEAGCPSDIWDPFGSLDVGVRSAAEITDLVIEAMGLLYGETYGRGYYSLGNRLALKSALEYLKAKHPRWPNVGFRDIYFALIALGTTPKAKRAAEGVGHIIVPREGLDPEGRNPLELLGRIASLTGYDQLCLSPGVLTDAQRSRAITFKDAIENRRVCYFWLPGTLGSSVTRTVCMLALYSLWAAASARTSKDQVYVILDEVQRIASKGMVRMLEQARDPAGLALVMASQTEAQLQDPDVDMRPIINATTRVRAYFAIDDPKIAADVAARSGKQIEEMTSRSTTWFSDGKSSYSEQTVPTKAPVVNEDVIDFLRDHPDMFLLYVPRGDGYTQYGGRPVGVQTTWGLSKELYDEWHRLKAWPLPLPGQVMNTGGPAAGDLRGSVLARDLTLAEPEAGSVGFAATDDAFERVKALSQEKLAKLLDEPPPRGGAGKKGRRDK
jgi:hypothetical protein